MGLETSTERLNIKPKGFIVRESEIRWYIIVGYTTGEGDVNIIDQILFLPTSHNGGFIYKHMNIQ